MISEIISAALGTGAATHIVGRIAVYGWRRYRAAGEPQRQQKRVAETSAWLQSIGEENAARRIQEEYGEPQA